MRKQYQKVMSAAVLTVGLMVAGSVLAGSLDPTNAPGPTMRTLQEIYDKQDATHQLVELIASPQALSATTTVVNAGYYEVTNLTQVDTDLAAGNIKTNVTIFGITGTLSTNTGSAYPAMVPKTGQTASYAAGDDGDLEKGVAWPNPRFTDNSNGTVTDNLTGLIWLQNANVFGVRTWAQALTDCATLNSGEGGLTDGSAEGDWRLPNVKELQSLIDYGRYNPALCNAAGTGQWTAGDPFTGVQSDYYWSSSTGADYTALAWYVSLCYGYVSTEKGSANEFKKTT